MLNGQIIKKDFPIFKRILHGNKPLVYLDSAATSQKPQVVLDAISNYYENHNANVHRGIHVLGDESTKLFYSSRETVATFFGAKSQELILSRNTTESINLVSYAWGDKNLKKGDVVLTTEMEHHSNIVPWQQLSKRTGCEVSYIKVKEDGMLDLEDFEKKLTKKVKLVAVVHVSNSLGTINPVKEMAVKAHKVGALMLVDGAQSAPHLPIDFKDLDCDFYAFSGHKMLGPMGIGGLLVKNNVLESMDPFLFGGGMIDTVSFENTTFAQLPDKFIAGTPDVAGVVGLAAACEYLTSLNMKEVHKQDSELVSYALSKLENIPQVTVIGPKDAKHRCGGVAFIYNGVHAHDVAQILDTEGVAVRSGHHCTMPLHQKFGWSSSTRASFSVYSSKEDIDVLVSSIKKVKTVFGK